MRKKAMLPNAVTLGNLFLGFLAIAMITQERFITASWLILVAAMLDGLDGMVARLVRESSRFGAEIDSFSDAVSFGLAPGLLVYHAVLRPLGIIGLILGFLPLATGVIRLVRFNLAPSSKKPKGWFLGLPIPTTAMSLCGFYLYTATLNDGVVKAPLYLSLIPLLSLLMVSPVPYRKLPVVPINNCRYPMLSRAFLVSMAVLVIWNPALTIFPMMMIYLMIGPIEWVIHLVRRTRNPELYDDIDNSAVYRQNKDISRRS